MKVFNVLLSSVLCIVLVSCNGASKKEVGNEPVKELSQNEISNGFDLDKELLVDLMMDIPASVYMKEGEGQYSILYIPKTKEILERYKNFEEKNGVKLSEDSLGNMYYDDVTVKKIDGLLRSGMNSNDFYIIGRFIPSQFLQVDATSTKGEYAVSMPYEMHIYKYTDNKWEYIETTMIMDLTGYEKYETLETYNSMFNK
ncbi:hypothetical protein JGH11_02860 [Dysgonomonas sp. Marseille-P4677]|uniref:hypothetical protein n=1 Tax=Dysgonomonas sp. Marseille-P4677 TaxID=2364790 RepID=UPI001912C07E|nr:hypothetical protein [Dysgonomonas sp. Marseille-P4677]MBK5719808.1 hypothetical protein [Dysgonomonas sp. Marseille-P4677]